MPPTHVEFVEEYIWQGPLGLWQAVLMGVVVMGAVAWLLWRESRYAGVRLARWFLLLRLIVILLVVGMLLGPALRTIRKELVHLQLTRGASLTQDVFMTHMQDAARRALTADVPAGVAASTQRRSK